MRKVIAAINMTLDGFCDHTAIVPDKELHNHYAEVLENAGVILYGRITYQLMEYWRTLVANPTGDESMDNFAKIMDRVPKIVFSRTLKSTDWESARISTMELEEEVRVLKEQPGKDIFIGSRSLIVSLTQLQLIDEYQLCVHPVIAGQGLPLFKDNSNRYVLNYIKSKNLSGGAVILYYSPSEERVK